MHIATHACRDQLLEEVRAERQARGDAKKRGAAALCIQRRWRGYASRRSTLAALSSSLIREYGPLVPAAERQLPAKDIVAGLLAPALFLLKATASTADPSLPFDLSASYTSKVRKGGSSSATATNASAQEYLRVVRCLLALLMRSMTSTDPKTCCLSLGLAEEASIKPQGMEGIDAASKAAAERWREGGGLAVAFLWACCRLICCRGGDALVDATAIRLIGIMIDPKQWKFMAAATDGRELRPTGWAVAAETCAASYQQALVSKPEALFSALGRLTAAAYSPGTNPTPGSPPAPAIPASASPASLLPKMQALVKLILAKGASQGQRESSNLAAAFARTALMSPGGYGQLSEDIRAQLRVPALATALCQSLIKGVASSGRSEGWGGPSPLWALGNLTLLLAGPVTASHGKQVH